MRVFISIDIPEQIQGEIKKIQDNLPEFRGKKTKPENLHLTLKFLGEIDEEKIKEVRKKLSEIKLNKFEGEINRIGVFSEKFIRIIWMHITNCDVLQKEVDSKLKYLFREEDRFMSHLTIARVKKIKDRREFLDKLKKIKFDKVKFFVDKFYLKESILNQEGPEYRIIEEYNLY